MTGLSCCFRGKCVEESKRRECEVQGGVGRGGFRFDIHPSAYNTHVLVALPGCLPVGSAGFLVLGGEDIMMFHGCWSGWVGFRDGPVGEISLALGGSWKMEEEGK